MQWIYNLSLRRAQAVPSDDMVTMSHHIGAQNNYSSRLSCSIAKGHVQRTCLSILGVWAGTPLSRKQCSIFRAHTLCRFQWKSQDTLLNRTSLTLQAPCTRCMISMERSTQIDVRFSKVCIPAVCPSNVNQNFSHFSHGTTPVTDVLFPFAASSPRSSFSCNACAHLPAMQGTCPAKPNDMKTSRFQNAASVKSFFSNSTRSFLVSSATYERPKMTFDRPYQPNWFLPPQAIGTDYRHKRGRSPSHQDWLRARSKSTNYSCRSQLKSI